MSSGNERKYPSDGGKRKFKQEVLNRVSKMSKLIVYFWPSTSSSLQKKNPEYSPKARFFEIQNIVHRCLCCQYWMISINKFHCMYTLTWVAETRDTYVLYSGTKRTRTWPRDPKQRKHGLLLEDENLCEAPAGSVSLLTVAQVSTQYHSITSSFLEILHLHTIIILQELCR
jgi:hypothetical protein